MSGVEDSLDAEEAVLLARSIEQDGVARGRRARNVVSHDVSQVLDLCRRGDAARVEGLQGGEVFQDARQLVGEARTLLRGDAEAGQRGDVVDVFRGEVHVQHQAERRRVRALPAGDAFVRGVGNPCIPLSRW